MRIDELQAEHFPLLAYIHDGFVPDPASSIALVAMENDEIIGRIFLMAPTHIEGPWIRPDKRSGLLGAKLIAHAEERAKACGLTKLFAYAVDEVIAGYLERLGYSQVPMTVWAKEI